MIDELLNLHIYRYMDMMHFIMLLESKKIRINRRNTFSDYLERSLELDNQFWLQAVGHNIPENLNYRLRANAVDLSEKSKSHKEYSYLPTSCWTLQEKEDYLMWKSYTNGVGVRIHTTVGNFMRSINGVEDRFNLLCNKIEYKIDNIYCSAEDNLFIKHPAYENEKEFRFYFLSQNENHTLHSMSLSETNQKRYIEVQVDTDDLIMDVTLSPFINEKVATVLKRWINAEYGVTVRLSTIKLN